MTQERIEARSRHARRKQSNRYRELFEAANEMILVHESSGQLLDANEKTCQRLGYSRAELLRKNYVDIQSPRYAPLFTQRLFELSRQGVAVHESAYVRRDGAVIPVQTSCRSFSYGGRPAILCIARDSMKNNHLSTAALLTKVREALKT